MPIKITGTGSYIPKKIVKNDEFLNRDFYDKEGNAIYWHNGGTGGYSSDMSVSVESQKSVVILSNVSSHVKETGQYRDLNFALLSLIE